MLQLDNVVRDRGSKYAVSGGQVANSAQAKSFLKSLKSKKKFAKATHNTWAVIYREGTFNDLGKDTGNVIRAKSDDGESGAGMIIVRMLEREAVYDHIVVVTRWYGGVHLGGDRFRHVQSCVNAYLDHAKLRNS
ncbi:MAG: putative IMPACT (imprinted ancient) family translation regulator [Arenicella sp.]|jgi:putative IMPACT (imprinted ancient) family translation regulator